MTAVVLAPEVALPRRVEGGTIQKNEFLRSYAHAVKSLERAQDSFLESPDEGMVQEVRTAVRRFDAHVPLLPGKIRKSPEVEELLERHRKILKRSARVSDANIIAAKVQVYPYWQEFLTARLLKHVRKRRRDLVKEMKRTVASARSLTTPALESWNLQQEKLESRFSAEVGELTERINTLVPVVAGDPNLVSLLERLREETARLHFVLEVAPKAGSAKILPFVDGLQESLGTVHDWDAVIVCLQEFDSPVAEEIVMAGVMTRVKVFRAFSRAVLNGRYIRSSEL